MYGFNLISQSRIQIGRSLWKLARTTLYLKRSLLCSCLWLLGHQLSFENPVMGFLQLPKACLLMLTPSHYKKTFHCIQLAGFYVAIWLLLPALLLGTHDIVVHFGLVLIINWSCSASVWTEVTSSVTSNWWSCNCYWKLGPLVLIVFMKKTNALMSSLLLKLVAVTGKNKTLSSFSLHHDVIIAASVHFN